MFDFVLDASHMKKMTSPLLVGVNLTLWIVFGDILEKMTINVLKVGRKHDHFCVINYPVVICGLGVLITGDDLRSHPIGSANEGVPSTNRLIQLCRHSKVNWEIKNIFKKCRTRLKTPVIFECL